MCWKAEWCGRGMACGANACVCVCAWSSLLWAWRSRRLIPPPNEE